MNEAASAIAMAVENPDELSSVPQDENTGRAVRIRWIDSGLFASGWRTLTEMPKLVERVESVGLWMGENEHCVMLGSSRDDANQTWLGAQLIWKPSIVSKEFLS